MAKKLVTTYYILELFWEYERDQHNYLNVTFTKPEKYGYYGDRCALFPEPFDTMQAALDAVQEHGDIDGNYTIVQRITPEYYRD